MSILPVLLMIARFIYTKFRRVGFAIAFLFFMLGFSESLASKLPEKSQLLSDFHRLSSIPDSSERLDKVTNQLGYHYAPLCSDSAFYFFNLLKEKALKKGDAEAVVKAYISIGSAHSHCRRYERGLRAYQDAWMYLKKNGLEKESIEILAALAGTYYNAGFYEAAKNYMFNQLTLILKYPEDDQQTVLASIYGNLGFVSMELAASDSTQYDSAFFYMNKSLESSKATGDPFLIAVSHDYMAHLELDLARFESAAYHFRTSLELLSGPDIGSSTVPKNIVVFQGRAYYGLAQVFDGENLPDSVLKYTALAEKIWCSDKVVENSVINKMVTLKLLKARAFEGKGDTEKAEHLFVSALHQADTIKRKRNSRAEAYLEASEYFARSGKWQAAYHANRKHLEIEAQKNRDADKFFFFSNHSFLMTSGMQVELESQEKEMKAANRMRNLSIGIAVLALLLLGLGIALMRFYIRASRASKAYSEELAAVNETKDKLMSVIGHDLRSPFSSLMGLSDQMAYQIEERNWQNVKASGRIIKEASTEAYFLFEELLSWAKSQSGQLPFQPELLDLKQIISHTLAVLSGMAAARKIGFDTHIDHQWGTGDAFMVSTTLRNLISNAITYSEPNSFIYIHVKAEDDHLLISVRDEGKGMRPEELAEILDGKNVRSGNTGLGLDLCRDFAKAHGAPLSIESKLGSGSCFSFQIEKASSPASENETMPPLKTAQANRQQLDSDLGAHAAALMPFRNLKIYQSSEAKKLLEALDTKGIPKLENWKINFNRAIDTFNEVEFNRLIDGLPQTYSSIQTGLPPAIEKT